MISFIHVSVHEIFDSAVKGWYLIMLGRSLGSCWWNYFFKKIVTFLRIPTCRNDKISVYKTSLVTRQRIRIHDPGLQFHFPNNLAPRAIGNLLFRTFVQLNVCLISAALSRLVSCLERGLLSRTVAGSWAWEIRQISQLTDFNILVHNYSVCV